MAFAQTPLQLIWKVKMKFGKVAPETTGGGTVVISSAANTTTITGNLTDFGGTIKRGKLQVIGDSKAYVIVSLPSTFTLRKGTGTHTMTVSNLTMNLTNPIRLSSQGKKNIYFGATLTVSPNQKKGTYNEDGDFIVDVDYQ